MNRQEFEYTHSNSPQNVQIFSGRGLLRAVVINTTAASSIVLTDDLLTASAGTSGNIGVIQASALPGTYRYDISISKGLTVYSAGSSDITVCWAKG